VVVTSVRVDDEGTELLLHGAVRVDVYALHGHPNSDGAGLTLVSPFSRGSRYKPANGTRNVPVSAKNDSA
jgi:hypothetical protein